MNRDQYLVKIRYHDPQDYPFLSIVRSPSWEWEVTNLLTDQQVGGFADTFEKTQEKIDWFFS